MYTYSWPGDKYARDSIVNDTNSPGIESIRTFHKFKEKKYILLAHKKSEHDTLGRIIYCKCLRGNDNFGEATSFKYSTGHLVEAFFDDKRVI